jgi:hypothetical protein
VSTPTCPGLAVSFALAALLCQACIVPPFDATGKQCDEVDLCPSGWFCAGRGGALFGVCEPFVRGSAEEPPTVETTGVPTGVTLSPSSGLSLDQPGTVVEGLDINGCVTISANDVTLRRSRVRCSGLYAVRVIDGATGTLIEDVELDGLGSIDTKGLVGRNVTARGVRIHSLLTGVVLQPQSVYERLHVTGLAGSGYGMQMSGGQDVRVRGSLIQVDVEQNAAIDARGALSSLSGLRIEGNWLGGGSDAILAINSGSYPAADVVIRDNFLLGGSRGYRVNGVSGLVWEGNVWAETGEAIPAP